jgi:hypothetical protein
MIPTVVSLYDLNFAEDILSSFLLKLRYLCFAVPFTVRAFSFVLDWELLRHVLVPGEG